MSNEVELEKQSELLAQVVSDLHNDKSERRRANHVFAIMIFAAILSVCDIAALTILLLNSSKIAKSSKNTEQLIRNAIPNKAGVTKAGEAVIVELDCLNRRAIAHLPSTPPNKPCVLPTTP